ncbi:MAG: nucleotidyltransferase family protein [Candidatus Peribacteraceae bacterium]|nr:nucleotidyltransferase family protein [Candidatus Peribacteraceae bacterium]
MSPTLKRYRRQILKLAREKGALNVRVFGSCSQGEETAKSDIDLLVRMAEGMSLFDQIAFMHAVADLTGKKVDVVDDRGLSPYLRDRILSEAIPL